VQIIGAKHWFRSIYQNAHGGALRSVTPSVKIYVVNFIAIYVDKPHRRHLQRASSTVLLLHRPASTPTTGRATVHNKLQLHCDPIYIDRTQRGTVCTATWVDWWPPASITCVDRTRGCDHGNGMSRLHFLDRSCSHAQGDKSRPTPTTSARLML
jgi:hypothetical protein